MNFLIQYWNILILATVIFFAISLFGAIFKKREYSLYFTLCFFSLLIDLLLSVKLRTMPRTSPSGWLLWSGIWVVLIIGILSLIKGIKLYRRITP